MTKEPTEELGFDPDVLRAKYREERDKRLRSEGLGQYVEMKGRFAEFERDSRPMRPLPRQRCGRALCVPTHAVLDRGARKSFD